jgi:hypothetical protein
MHCQIGDCIQVGNSVEVIVVDVRNDEVVLDVNDELASVRFVNE